MAPASPGALHLDPAAAQELLRRHGIPMPEQAVVDTPEAAAVAAAAREMAARIPGLGGYLVQPMAPSGVELIVGLKRDPVFGPVVLAGLGGVWVELLEDVSLRLAPVTPEEARSMLAELRGARLLAGYRGA